MGVLDVQCGEARVGALATGVCGLRAGIVDADVACELGHLSRPSLVSRSVPFPRFTVASPVYPSSLLWLFLLQFRAQMNHAACDIERPAPIGEALLLDRDLVAPSGYCHSGGRVANKCAVYLNVCAGNA